MSDNKMGGVPCETREALDRFFDEIDDGDDVKWAKVIRKMTRLGVKKTLRRLRANETLARLKRK